MVKRTLFPKEKKTAPVPEEEKKKKKKMERIPLAPKNCKTFVSQKHADSIFDVRKGEDTSCKRPKLE
jgi:hypothetical protein